MRNLHRSLLKTSETPTLDFRPEKVKSSFQASFSEKENNPRLHLHLQSLHLDAQTESQPPTCSILLAPTSPRQVTPSALQL